VWPRSPTPLVHVADRPCSDRPGSFDCRFATNLAGVYVARVRASGSDSHGNRFTREQTVTAAVWATTTARDRSPGGIRARCCAADRQARLGERAVAALREAASTSTSSDAASRGVAGSPERQYV